ncbi:hypothetical protein NLI96_g8480 [Meripilus lineatus]|uniref:Ubiquitin-like protease family profile domain-containing protein n=1 Tax=Meripilus lineatus TaxID=2056292 RepID=A0AAD5UXI5_9APHY|nr:hypothetical protein NLI96_g8480 [Physisporinus lineatus]
MEHRLGGNASPSEASGILSRWKLLIQETLHLTRDTLSALVGAPRQFEPQPLPQPRPRPIRNRHPSPPPRRQPKPELHPQPSSSSQGRQETHTGLPSPPSTHATTLSSSPTASLLGSYTQLDVELELLKATQERDRVRKRPHTREHIHAKAHKDKLAQIRQNDLDDMQKELYEMHRKRGFSSDYSDFQDFIHFRQRLERLQNLEVLATSRSLSDLRAKAEADERARRHSHEDYSRYWYKRALAHAKASIESPKPFRPSTSFFDQLQKLQAAKDQEIEGKLRPKVQPLPDRLPPDDEAKVASLLLRRGVISKCEREQVTDKDLSRLNPRAWLNDELINFYGQLILSRGEGRKENQPANGSGRAITPLKVHYFNTFFWTKLKGDGYEKSRLAKWTKKIDIFSKDVILIPINHNNSHWTSAAINFRKKRIECYDSMGMDQSAVHRGLRAYLDAEHRNKKKKPFDFTDWVDYTSEDFPQQENGYDCGVFTCQTLESLARGAETFAFRQSNMPYLRRRMVWEIGHAKLWEGS